MRHNSLIQTSGQHQINIPYQGGNNITIHFYSSDAVDGPLLELFTSICHSPVTYTVKYYKKNNSVVASSIYGYFVIVPLNLTTLSSRYFRTSLLVIFYNKSI